MCTNKTDEAVKESFSRNYAVNTIQLTVLCPKCQPYNGHSICFCSMTQSANQ